MNELKFRGFDKTNMVEVRRIHIDQDGAVWWSPNGNSNPLYNAESYPLMQWIFETDKNGKDIYQGDIVQTDEAGWKAQVIRNGDMFMCIGLDGKGFSSECNWKNFEVIGDIYRNSDMLKKS